MLPWALHCGSLELVRCTEWLGFCSHGSVPGSTVVCTRDLIVHSVTVACTRGRYAEVGVIKHRDDDLHCESER